MKSMLFILLLSISLARGFTAGSCITLCQENVFVVAAQGTNSTLRLASTGGITPDHEIITLEIAEDAIATVRSSGLVMSAGSSVRTNYLDDASSGKISVSADLDMSNNKITNAQLPKTTIIYDTEDAGTVKITPGTALGILELSNTAAALYKVPDIGDDALHGGDPLEDQFVLVQEEQTIIHKSVRFQHSGPDGTVLDTHDRGSFEPELKFDGANVGMEYDIQIGEYERTGSSVNIAIVLTFTDMGNSSGNATIQGLPFPARNQTGLSQPLKTDMANLQSFVAQVTAFTVPTESYLRLTFSPTVIDLVDIPQDFSLTVFPSTAKIWISGFYFTDPY